MSTQQSIDTLLASFKEVLESGQDVNVAEVPFIIIKGDIDGKGILWSGQGHNKQFLFASKPDRFFISENIDLAKGKNISINNIKLLDEKELGATVTKSNLREVGHLKGLIVDGSMRIDQYIVYDSNTNRLGIGIENPNAALSIAEDGVEIILGTTNGVKGVIGTFASHNLDIVTDNTPRISIEAGGNITLGSTVNKVTILGTLGINVNNPDPRAALHVNGSIKFNNKIHLSDNNFPTSGHYTVGDIVWNNQPAAGRFVGWVCVVEGSPGLWNGFGRIE